MVSDNVVSTSNWSNFGRLLRRAGLSAIAGLSCKNYSYVERLHLLHMPRLEMRRMQNDLICC